MKFLFEADTETSLANLDKQLSKLSTDNDKYNFIKRELLKVNKNNLSNNLTTYIRNLYKAGGFNTKYGKYLLNLERVIDPDIGLVIEKLITNGHLDPTSKENSWLKENSLYSEDVEDTIEKIKYLTFITNPQNVNKYAVEFNLDDFRDETGKLKSYIDMQAQFNEYTGGKEGIPIANILKDKLVGEYSLDNIKRFILNNVDITDKTKKDIQNGTLDKYILNTLLKNNISNKADLEDSIASILAPDKTLATTHSESEKGTNKQTGEDYLRSLLANDYNDATIREYIIKNTTLDGTNKYQDERIKNEISLGTFDEVIDNILDKKLYSAMGRGLEKKLLDNLATAIYNAYMKDNR